MVVQQEGGQSERVLGAVRSADVLSEVLHQPLSQSHFPERRSRVSRAAASVPMVALECELPPSGRLSPPADAPMSRLVQPPAPSSPGDDHDSESVLPLPPHLPSPGSYDRAGSKRKLPPRSEGMCEGCPCAVDGQPVHVGTASCSSSSSSSFFSSCSSCSCSCECVVESKRRRLSEGCPDVENVTVGEEGEDAVDSHKSEQPQNVLVIPAHMDLGVEQTLDVMTSSESAAEQDAAPFVRTAVCDLPTGLGSPQDVVMETSGAAFTEDFPGSVTAEVVESVVEVDVMVGGDSSPPPPSHRPSSAHQCHPDTDVPCADDGSSEEGDEDAFSEVCPPRPQRISPFLNTPKQRKEERRKVLKLSIHKMRAVEDPEHFLRRSVLINNTMKRLQRDLREEKMRNSPRKSCYGLYRRSAPFYYDALNHNNCMLSDESFALGDNDRITDDMTDALVTRLEATSSQLVVPTPSPSPCPLDETETSLVDFPVSSSSDECPPVLPASSSSSLSSCLSDVTSSVTESMSVMTSEMTPSSLAEPSLSDELMSPASESASLEAESMSSGSDLTSSVSDLTSSVTDLTPPSGVSSSSSSTSSLSVSVPCTGTYDNAFTVSSLVRECQSPSSSCSCESQREKQLYTDIDVVFNNLIHALGDS